MVGIQRSARLASNGLPRRGCHSSSPGQRPGNRDHHRRGPDRSNGPTIHREFGERLARWADLLCVVHLVPRALPWAVRTRGPSARKPASTASLNGIAVLPVVFSRQQETRHVKRGWSFFRRRRIVRPGSPPHFLRRRRILIANAPTSMANAMPPHHRTATSRCGGGDGTS
jgi:hypothetical protein